MPGRTPTEAFQAFADPIGRALACVAHCKLTPSPGGRAEPSGEHQLLVNGGERLQLAGAEHLSLGMRMKYRFVKRDDLPDGPWKVQTLAYSYTVYRADEAEIVSFHWHPGGTSHAGTPHLHLGSTQLHADAVLSNKQHMPTGRIAIEQVVGQLIIEHGVEPIAPDWQKRLMLSQGVFELYRTWA